MRLPAVINAQYHCFSEVHGQGLLLGAVLAPEYQARPRHLWDAWIGCVSGGANVVRFAPALNLSREEFDPWACNVLRPPSQRSLPADR